MARIDDGHSTTIAIGATQFWEKTVTPPGIEGGGANDTTTMHNETYRTKAPKKLKSMTEMKCQVAYDPAVYPEVVGLIQVNKEITITFPDGSTLKFWGWLDSFVPSEAKEGEQATADVTVIASNQNASGVETAPVYTAASTGT